MKQKLEIKTLSNEDIKFLKEQLNCGYKILFFISLISIGFPSFCIYLILIDTTITEKTLAFLGIIVCFGFWTYLTFNRMKKVIKEKRNLNLQEKIEGNIEVLDKEIITIDGDDSNDTYLYLLKVYSEIEKKYKNISVMEKHYNKIQIGKFIWIEYYLDCNYIKTLVFEKENINYKVFRKYHVSIV